MANNSMGKTQFTPAHIDPLTVGDIVRFIKKSHRFSSSIQWQLESHRGWLMDPHRGLSLRGDATNALPLLELGTWNLMVYHLSLNVCVGYIALRRVAVVPANLHHHWSAITANGRTTWAGRCTSMYRCNSEHVIRTLRQSLSRWVVSVTYCVRLCMLSSCRTWQLVFWSVATSRWMLTMLAMITTNAERRRSLDAI